MARPFLVFALRSECSLILRVQSRLTFNLVRWCACKFHHVLYRFGRGAAPSHLFTFTIESESLGLGRDVVFTTIDGTWAEWRSNCTIEFRQAS